MPNLRLNEERLDSLLMTADTLRPLTVGKRWMQSTYIGVPLVVGGLIEMGQNRKFRSLRNGYMTSFHHEADSYTQYAPAAVLLAMKAAGVKGRKPWGEMLTADAFSTLIMVSLVNGIKYTARVERPDGTQHNSFPSGHTATAFMTATMLSKEYGHISPLISLGAYTTATATGVMRMANNRHWMSDVLAGAGIGIMSTEFGYWLSDIVFKHKATQQDLVNHWRNYEPSNPSFIGFHAGFQIPLTKYNMNEDVTFYTSTGSTIGIEGAWFWNHHWGVGGKADISSIYYSIEDEDNENGETFRFQTCQAGIFYNKSIYRHLYVGAKALLGLNYYSSVHNEFNDCPSRFGPTGSIGSSLGIVANKQLDINFFLDYNLLPAHSKSSSQAISTLGLGAKTSYRF